MFERTALGLTPRLGVGAALAAILLLAACSGDSADKRTSTTTSAPPATQGLTQATTQPATLASPTPAERLEVTRVKSARPYIANLVAALEKGDVAAARTAFAPYNGVWNGVEVYVNFRSVDLYRDIEANWEAAVTAALAKPDANAAEILPMAKSMLAAYDKGIALCEAGPPLSPLFDDVGAIRIARAPFRDVRPALDAGDVAGAKVSFTAFDKAWPTVSSLFKARSATAYQEAADAIAALEAAWAKPNPTAAELTPLVVTATARFNYGLSLVNAAARGADVAKTAVAPIDLTSARALRAIEDQLTASLKSWTSGSYADSAKSAAAAQAGLTSDPAVAAQLKARAVDANLKTAIDAYAALAGAAGDTAKVSAANKAAFEALEVAIQWCVGQFWTDPSVQSALGKPATTAANPTTTASNASVSNTGKVSANNSSRAELQKAFEAAGIPGAARMAVEVEEYRPYPTYDTKMAKLRQELAKYNIPTNVVDQVIATLILD